MLTKYNAILVYLPPDKCLQMVHDILLLPCIAPHVAISLDLRFVNTGGLMTPLYAIYTGSWLLELESNFYSLAMPVSTVVQ